MEVQIFSRFNRPFVSGLICKTPSKTSQEFKDEVNINNLLKKYTAQAQVMGVPVSELLPKLGSAAYGDMTNLGDFMDMENKRAQLIQLFESLPSDVRRKYGDRLEGFVFALNDSTEYRYLAEKGVLNKREVEDYFNAATSQSQISSGQKESETSKSVVSQNGESKKE